MMDRWPQFIVGAFLLAIVVAGFVKHGKPIDTKPINCIDVIWRVFVIAAVLGAGGFWKWSWPA